MAGTTGAIEFEHVGIGTALNRNRLVVPVNQREYSWEKKHAQELFQDFARAIGENKKSYFLGTVVLTIGKNGAFDVADGQQRLATSTILLAAIRDWFFAKKDSLLVNSIENEFLFTVIRETRETVPRLTLNVQDRDFFIKRILAKPKTPDRIAALPTKPSHHQIQQASELAEKYVKDILKPLGQNDRVPTLNRWVEFIQSSAQVIVLKVPDDLNAFVMFETLNDRGLKTSQSDLLKNYLFGEADDRIAEAQPKWVEMTGLLEAGGDDDIMITYLRHVTISLYGYTREREVFEAIKSRVQGKGYAIQFLQGLADNAADYIALTNPNHRKWNSFAGTIRRSIEALNLLKVVAMRPLMLAVVRRFTPKETDKAFRLFVSLAVRFFVTRGARSGIVEESYGDAAKKINDGTITSVAGIVADLDKIIPTDVEFKEGFATLRVSQSSIARYLLRSLEQTVKGDPEPELIPNNDPVINLEHVLPQNPDTNWPGVPPETCEAYCYRLGNMVLLKASSNNLIANSPFAVKQPVLKASIYKLTSQVAEQTSWGSKEIMDRQAELADLALKTWKVDASK